VFAADKVARVRGSRRRRLRSHRLLAVAVAVVILASVGGGSAVGYANLKTRADALQAALTTYLQAGQRELEAGKTSLTEANSKHDTSLVTQATAHFTAAKAQFLAAGQLADDSRLLHYLEQIPAVGGSVHSRHAAVAGIAGMGVALSEAGQELAGLDAQLIKPSVAGQAGRTVLTVLDQTTASLVKVRTDLDRAQKAAAQVDVQVVPGGQQATFVKARATIASALAGLDEFERLVPTLKEVLGGNGPRTYLIEQVDPAELRAGGGFIGTYSLIRADHGTLTVVKSGNAYDLADPRPKPGQAGFIPQLGPYREVIPDTSWSFVDSNLYPDFASNAKAAESFVQPRIADKVDGVISMDYYVVAKMLELTGPLTVPGYGITVDANNIIQVLVSGSIAADAAHKAIPGAIAGALLQRVAILPPDRWPALIGAFNDLAATRHFQTYFNSDGAEGEIGRVGWSGNVNPTGAQDYMMEVESNYYGDKANYYLTRHYTVELTRHGATLHHKVTVDLVNAMPSGVSPRTAYRVNIRLYVGDTTSSGSDNLRPVKYSNPAPPEGTHLMDGWLPDIACCGGRGQAVFEYDSPWPASDRGSHQVYWQKQPGTVNDKIDVTWTDENGHTFKVSGDLGQDRVITLSPNGVTLTAGQPAQATLPSLSLG
jgi:hypothetical protein